MSKHQIITNMFIMALYDL